MMRKLLWSLFVLVALSACDGKKDVAPPPESEAPTDSVEAEPDSLEQVAEEVIPPKSADELFNDFIYGFMTSRKFQKERVRFPLPYVEMGRRDSLKAGQWRFDPLYSRRETYTVIYGRVKDKRMAKSTQLDSVVVETLNLVRKRVKQYLFQRGPIGWMLTSIQVTPLSANENSDFLTFYQRFATDSVFQRAHVAEFVDFTTYDTSTFEEISGTVDVDQWFAFRPELPHNEITNVCYGQSYRHTPYRIVVIDGLSNSMTSSLTFKREGRTWKLVAFEN